MLVVTCQSKQSERDLETVNSLMHASFVTDRTPLKDNRAEPPAARVRILCVDDDPNVSAAIARRLRPFDIDVIRAYSGMQGYWQMVTESPDAVVVDLAMPNGSGKELIECAMRNAATMYIPMIVLTGSRARDLQPSLFRMGVSGFLQKPVARERLLWELGHHIDLCDRAMRAAAG